MVMGMGCGVCVLWFSQAACGMSPVYPRLSQNLCVSSFFPEYVLAITTRGTILEALAPHSVWGPFTVSLPSEASSVHSSQGPSLPFCSSPAHTPGGRLRDLLLSGWKLILTSR